MSVLNDLKKLLHSRFPLSLFFIISFTLFPIISSSHLPIISNAWSATYYVDATNGNDYYSGLSQSTPWKTIAKVNASRFNPGDQILFKRGEVWREQLVVPSSGVPNNPIVFGAYGEGPLPVLSGAASTNEYILSINRRNYLTIENLVLTRSNGAAINLYGSQYITIRNCTVKDNYDSGLSLCGNSIVESCVVQSNGGYGILYAGNGNTITGNLIQDNGWRNIVSSGINGQGSGDVISKNTLSNNGSGGPLGYNHGIYVDIGSADTKVLENTVYGHINGHGIYCKGSAEIARNLVYNNMFAGIAVGFNGATAVRSKIHYNIAHGNAYGILQRSKGTGSLQIEVYNNTLYDNSNNLAEAYPAEIQLENDLTGVRIYNNIFQPVDTGKAYSMVGQNNASIDYNCIYKARAGPLISYAGGEVSWSVWQASGRDTHGYKLDPKIVNPTTGDFHLKLNSPCIDRGTNVGLTQDFSGTPVGGQGTVDIGAFKHVRISAPRGLRIT